VTREALDRRQLLRSLGLGAAALAVPATAHAAAGSGFLEPHPRWRFVFVNHATTNPFFVPTRYGIQDACRHYGVAYGWTGSRRSDVGEMVEALSRGIPVVSYNADGGIGNRRLAYIGQDLYQSGLKFGARVAELVKEGDVFLFIATPGQLNIQPRIDGALDAIKDSGLPIRASVVATGTGVTEERRRIEATYAAHRKLRGMFAVDGGSTLGVAQVMQKHGLRKRGVRAGGYDLLPGTLRAIAGGHLDFTIDQQPYLQGFLPIFQLFMVRYSGGLVAPSDTNTGLLFVTRGNVRPYLATTTRYEGSSAVSEYPVT
jgi:simple sugar transport system substrate-binding protein